MESGFWGVVVVKEWRGSLPVDFDLTVDLSFTYT